MVASKIPPHALSLSRFLLRSEVLKLYREILRTLKEIPNESHRKELLQWARHDFKNNKHHTDEAVIKMMLTQGKRTLYETSQAIKMAR